MSADDNSSRLNKSEANQSFEENEINTDNLNENHIIRHDGQKSAVNDQKLSVSYQPHSTQMRRNFTNLNCENLQIKSPLKETVFSDMTENGTENYIKISECNDEKKLPTDCQNLRWNDSDLQNKQPLPSFNESFPSQSQFFGFSNQFNNIFNTFVSSPHYNAESTCFTVPINYTGASHSNNLVQPNHVIPEVHEHLSESSSIGESSSSITSPYIHIAQSFTQSESLLNRFSTTENIPTSPSGHNIRQFATISAKSPPEQHKPIHGRPYICDICRTGFKYKSSFDKHKLCHSSEFPFKCDICDKAYAEKTSLRRHAIKHSGNKSHICDICGKAFYIIHELNRHKNIHTNE